MQLSENQVIEINNIINSELEEGSFADILKNGVKKIMPAGKRVLSAEEQAAKSAATIKAAKARTALSKQKVEVEKRAFDLHNQVKARQPHAWDGVKNFRAESYQNMKENLMSFISEFYLHELESREAGIKGMNDESMPIKTKGSATSNPKDTSSGDGAFVAGTMKFPKGNMVSGDLGKGSEQDHDNINGQRAGVRTPSQMAAAAMKGIFKEGSSDLEEGMRGAAKGGAVVGGFYGVIGGASSGTSAVIKKMIAKKHLASLKQKFMETKDKDKRTYLKNQIDELEENIAKYSIGKETAKGAATGAVIGAGMGAYGGHNAQKQGHPYFQ